MKQQVKIQEEAEVSIKRLVTDRFVKTVDQAVKKGVVKNEREFAQVINEPQEEFSRLKNPNGTRKRYADLEMAYYAVNKLGFNANYFLVEGGEKTESLLREGIHITGGTVNGNNNVVLTGQAVSQNGDVYLNVEKIIQNLPLKERKAILKQLGGLTDEIEALKKTIDRYEREIETQEKLIKTQEKFINALEQGKSKKK